MTRDERSEYEAEHWTVDRRIPVVFIVSLFIMFTVNFAGGVWYVSKLDNRISLSEIRIVSLEAKTTGAEIQRSDISNRVIRIEGKIENQNELLRRIDAKLDQLDGHTRPNLQ